MRIIDPSTQPTCLYIGIHVAMYFLKPFNKENNNSVQKNETKMSGEKRNDGIGRKEKKQTAPKTHVLETVSDI